MERVSFFSQFRVLGLKLGKFLLLCCEFGLEFRRLALKQLLLQPVVFHRSLQLFNSLAQLRLFLFKLLNRVLQVTLRRASFVQLNFEFVDFFLFTSQLQREFLLLPLHTSLARLQLGELARERRDFILLLLQVLFQASGSEFCGRTPILQRRLRTQSQRVFVLPLLHERLQ